MQFKKTHYKGYEIEISEDGRYIKVDGVKRTPYRIKPLRTTRGFMQVWIKRGIKAYVHRLVAKAWLPDYDDSLQVLHKNTNTIYNHYTNLEMGVSAKVHKNMKKAGRLVGRKAMFIKNEDDFEIAIKMLQDDITLKEIANHFNTSDMAIHRFKKRYSNLINDEKESSPIQ